jgi:hypothetical protein
MYQQYHIKIINYIYVEALKIYERAWFLRCRLVVA